VNVSKWTNIQLALGSFAASLIATPLIIFGVLQLPGRWTDIVGIPLVWPWWLIAKYGTRSLPAEMAGAYEPLGHPLMHVLGIVANALYLAAVLYLVVRVLAKGHRSEDAA